MELLQRLREQFVHIWRQMPPGRRAALAVAAVAVVAATAAVGYWASRAEYSTLYTQLTYEDAGAVTAQLQSLGVPYRLEASGTAVLVPAAQLDRARLSLAVEGLPAKSGKGFELLDDAGLGTTPFREHVNYIRALQGELTRTIMQVDGVTAARVHIVRPEQSPFIREQKATTASVLLRLRPGAVLGRRVVAGIVALVSRAVEGLTPENVTVVDSLGRQLSEPADPTAAQVASQLEYQQSVERHLAAKAEELLREILGPGRAVVKVTAAMNFQRLKQVKESYPADGRVIESETITNTKSNSARPGPGGAPGATSNLPNRSGNEAKAQVENSQEEKIETKFAVSKLVQEMEDAVGGIERITVAAAVDLAAEEGQGVPQITLSEIEEQIKKAVGFVPDRDEITVSAVKLQGQVEQPEPAETPKQGWEDVLAVVQTGTLCLAVLVVLVLVWSYLRPRRAPAPAPAAPPDGPRERVLRRVSALAQQNPEALARVLTAWLEHANGNGQAAHDGNGQAAHNGNGHPARNGSAPAKTG